VTIRTRKKVKHIKAKYAAIPPGRLERGDAFFTTRIDRLTSGNKLAIYDYSLVEGPKIYLSTSKSKNQNKMLWYYLPHEAYDRVKHYHFYTTLEESELAIFWSKEQAQEYANALAKYYRL
jgi:hypothetical protein